MASETPEKWAFLAIFAANLAYPRKPRGAVRFFFAIFRDMAHVNRDFFGAWEQDCKFSRTIRSYIT